MLSQVNVINKQLISKSGWHEFVVFGLRLPSTWKSVKADAATTQHTMLPKLTN